MMHTTQLIQQESKQKKPNLYILSGGASTRFGARGEDKARANFLGRPLITYAAQVLREHVRAIKVIANHERTYEDLGFETIHDVIPDQGPLGGIYTACQDTTANTPWCVLISCDLVHVQASWLDTLLLHARDTDLDAVVFRGEQWQPHFALYHARFAPLILKQLKRKQRAVWRALELACVRALPLPKDWKPLHSVNTQSELEHALQTHHTNTSYKDPVYTTQLTT